MCSYLTFDLNTTTYIRGRDKFEYNIEQKSPSNPRGADATKLKQVERLINFYKSYDAIPD